LRHSLLNVIQNPQLSHRTHNCHPEPATVILNAVKDLSILAADPIQLLPQQPLTETLR